MMNKVVITVVESEEGVIELDTEFFPPLKGSTLDMPLCHLASLEMISNFNQRYNGEIVELE